MTDIKEMFELPTDPLSAILMLPLLPIMLPMMLIQYQQSMFSQLFNNNSSTKSKVTQIIRNDNELTIIEKYL